LSLFLEYLKVNPMSKQKFNPIARRRARQLALQVLYAAEMNPLDLVELKSLGRQQPHFLKVDHLYFSLLLEGIDEHRSTLDILITPLLDRDFTELDPIELCILRLGAFELIHRDDIPPKVVLNEAIELAKLFGASESHKYINGVLDKLAKQHRNDEMEAS
jgi:transcription antitermination protein NusB